MYKISCLYHSRQNFHISAGLFVDDNAEPEEEETSTKLHVETNMTNYYVSDPEAESPHCRPIIQAHDSAEGGGSATSSSCLIDPLGLHFPAECTADSQENCMVLPSDNAAAARSFSDAAAAASRYPLATPAQLDKLHISEECFDVYFETLPSGKTDDPLALSDATYKLREVDDIKRAKGMIKSAFTNSTANRLIGLGASKETAKKLADMVMNGKDVKINADKDEQYSMYDIYEFYRYWLAVKSYQVLIIRATAIGNVDERPRRKEEMENFCCQAFPPQHFDAARMREMILGREVSSREDIKTFICDFFRRPDGIRAKYALHAMIVFFGHGSPQGFCVGHQHMPLDEITLLVKDEWREAILEHPGQLPVKVEIVFTQCYGYLHNQVVQTDRFRVIALTTAEHSATFSIPDENGRFVNDNLTPFAERTLRQEVAGMEAWRCSDNDGFVDLLKGQSWGETGADSAAAPASEDSVMHSEGTDDGPRST